MYDVTSCLQLQEQQSFSHNNRFTVLVWHYPSKPVPEETFTHPPSWSSSNLFQLLQERKGKWMHLESLTDSRHPQNVKNYHVKTEKLIRLYTKVLFYNAARIQSSLQKSDLWHHHSSLTFAISTSKLHLQFTPAVANTIQIIHSILRISGIIKRNYCR